MKIAFTYILLLTASVFVCLHCCGQSYENAGLYNRVMQVEKSSLPEIKKLNELYKIKATAEKLAIKDSGYFITLIKTAKYESLVNNNNQLATQYSLAALHINRVSHDKINRDLVINATYNLATYYQALQNENNALAYYDTTILLCGKNDPDDYIITSRYQRTSLYFYIADFQKVIEESTLGIEEANFRNDSYHYTCFLNQRANAYLYQNQIAKATDDVDKALRVGQNATSILQLFELAYSYKTKAQLFDRQKDYKQAEVYFQKAVSVRPHIPYLIAAVASDYNDIGIFYLHSLHDFAKARINFLSVVSYANQCDAENRSILLVMAYENLGELYSKEGNLDESLKYYQFACQAKHLGITNFLLSNISINELSKIEHKDILYSLLTGRTELLFQYYKKTKQEKYLAACLQTAFLTDTFITQTRHENLGEGSKLYWRNETRDFFSTAIEASYCSNDINSGFYFMEKSRSVLLSDKWNEMQAASLLSPEEARKEELLRIKIIEQQQALSSLNTTSNEYSRAEINLLTSRNEFDHFIRFLEKEHPLYYRSKYADDSPSLPELRSYLRDNNQSFIYYFTNDSALYALGISKNENKFIRISSTAFDCQQLSDYIRLCSDKQAINSHYTLFSSLSQTIYKNIFQPLCLPKGKVAVCTDNFFIPFEALCTDNKGKQFLLNDYSFSYVYSARSLVKPYLCNNKPEGNFAGFAPISFSASLQVFPLVNSSEALKEASQHYSNNVLFTQQQSTRYNFFRQASRYAVVTIFSHAQADTSDKEPVLYMQDSLIHLSELQMLNKPAIQFVLLSACQTNIGKNATGEGIFSLARGFAAAGVTSVSATLWKADEETVYKISGKFNEYLAKGMNKSVALQQAKLWYLQNSDHEHALPFYWANMVLIGSSNPVTLIQPNHNWLWAIIITAAVLLFMLVISIYKKRKTIYRSANMNK